MKNIKSGVLLLMVSVAAIAMLSFSQFNSVVKGSASPPDATSRAWLFSGTDTVNTVVDHGNFEFHNVKPGHYTLMVEGIPPYRNSTREGVVVVDGQPTDVGDIGMRK